MNLWTLAFCIAQSLFPAPPFVTAAKTPPQTLAAMREAVLRALDRPSIAAAKATLLLSGVEVLPDDAYVPIESLESLAHNHNYREIPGSVLAAG